MAEVSSYAADLRAIGRERLPWEQLRGANILLTGATGLIGSALAVALLTGTDVPFSLYAACRSREKAARVLGSLTADSRLRLLEYDAALPLQCTENFDYIIHAASPAAPKAFATEPVEVMMANILGLKNLLSYGHRHGMKRLLFVSSGEVYGEGSGKPFIETDSGYVDCNSPRACYPSSKRAAETLCAAFGAEYGADVVIARLCHTFGPAFSDSDNRVYAQFLRNAVSGNDIVMKSQGLQKRSWIYVADAVRALLFILLKGQRGEAYNVANSESVATIRQLAEVIAALGGRKVVIEEQIAEAGTVSTPITCATFSTDKLQRLGWRPLFSLEQGLKSTFLELASK